MPPHDRFPCTTRCSRPLWLRPVLVSLAGAALLAGCGADAGGSANGGSRPPTTVSAGIDTESGTASLGSEPRLGTSLQPTPQPTPRTTSSPATTPTASASKTSVSTSPATTAPSAVHWPKALGEPQHGQPVWAVYLATGHSAGDAAIQLAVRQAASVGYHAVVGDVACDEGAMAALGLDQYDFWSAATLYFADQADARAFATAYTARVRPPRGVAKVNIGCLD